MADTIVNLVLGKLADSVMQEALLLYGVRDKVEWVKRELAWIQSFLVDLDAKRNKDERVKRWVSEVKEVAYWIEDTLDQFMVEVEQEGEVDGGSHSQSQKGLRKKLKKIGKKAIEPIAKHKIGSEMSKIQERIREISTSRINYGITDLKDCSGGSARHARRIVIPEIDETEVIGFGDHKNKIVSRLIDTNISRRSVVSIVGTGGLGKTTLAAKIYKSAEVEHRFEFKIWLSISLEFKLIDIVKKILRKLQKIGSEMQEIEEELFIAELYNSLRGKIYLIVLDDVWSTDLWAQLQVALPEAKNGSRVLITTRFKNIGKEADALSEPYELQFLNEEHSQELLLRKAFPDRDCPDDLLPLADQFAKRCGGLPLALVVLGGILSTRNPDYLTWDRVMKTVDWHTDGGKCLDVISTSYDDLPIHLKPCFLYFALFPEDYQIKAASLIQMWIAEGFIQEMPTKTMEDTGENYIEELAQRCLVQVSKRSCTGKIKYCYIHDLLRDIAVQKANEDDFAMVFSKNTNLSCSVFARRVALHFCGNRPIDRVSKNLRSLMYFGEEAPNCNRFGMLKVLNVVGGNRAYDIKSMKEDWSSLRYFGFCIYDRSRQTLSNASRLAQLKNLQTVYLQYCHIVGELPTSFWDNKLLRHVNFSYCGTSPEGPPSSANLENLLTLKWVRARKEWGTKLPHFPHIRKLAITIPEDVATESIIDLLSDLKDVSSLYLREEGVVRMVFPSSTSAFRNHHLLHSLYLNGIWPKKEVDSSLLPPHLVKLTLDYFQLGLDPMPQLEKLPNLRVLIIKQTTMKEADRKQMVCSGGAFRRLQILQIRYVSDLNELKIEEGAMSMLNQLVLIGCDQLQVVPDLQYLTNLRELRVQSMRNEFKRRLQGQDQWKIAHILSVTTFD